MTVSAQNSYQKPVFTSDGSELGCVVNVVFSKVSGEANLVIFPSVSQVKGLDRKNRLSQSVVQAASSAAAGALSYIPGLNIASDVISEVTTFGTTESSNKFQAKLDKIQKTYYFIPAASIKETKEDSLLLSLPAKDCEDWFSNITPSTDTEMAFYDYSYYRGPQTMNQINLNLQPLRGKPIQDAGGATARIIDVKIDPAKGAISEIEVITPKGRKLLPMSVVKIDFNNITSSTKFDESAETAPASPPNSAPTNPADSAQANPNDTAPADPTPQADSAPAQPSQANST